MIEKMVQWRLVWIEDLNKNAVLLIQLVVTEKAENPCVHFWQKETITMEKESCDKSLLL